MPILRGERQLRQNGEKPGSASFEVRILVLPDEHEARSDGLTGKQAVTAGA